MAKTIVEWDDLVTAYHYCELRLGAGGICVRIQGNRTAYRIFDGEYGDAFDQTWFWESVLEMGTVDCDLQVG